MLKQLLAVIGLLVIAEVASAQDGSFQTAYGSGDYFVVEWKLCDGAPANCGEFNLDTAAYGVTPTRRLGIPSFVVIEMQKDNCSVKNTIIPRGLSETAGVAHNYHAGITLTGGGTSSIVVDPVRHRFYDATMSGGSGGTCDDVEVVLRAFYSLLR